MKNFKFLIPILFLVFSLQAQVVKPYKISQPLQLESVAASTSVSDSVLVYSSGKIVKFVPRSEFGGGGGVPDLESVLTQGNTASSNIKLTGNKRNLTFENAGQRRVILEDTGAQGELSLLKEDESTGVRISPNPISDTSNNFVFPYGDLGGTRTLPVSVNGNYADDSGNITVSGGGSQTLQQTMENGKLYLDLPNGNIFGYIGPDDAVFKNKWGNISLLDSINGVFLEHNNEVNRVRLQVVASTEEGHRLEYKLDETKPDGDYILATTDDIPNISSITLDAVLANGNTTPNSAMFTYDDEAGTQYNTNISAGNISNTYVSTLEGAFNSSVSVGTESVTVRNDETNQASNLSYSGLQLSSSSGSGSNLLLLQAENAGLGNKNVQLPNYEGTLAATLNGEPADVNGNINFGLQNIVDGSGTNIATKGNSFFALLNGEGAVAATILVESNDVVGVGQKSSIYNFGALGLSVDSYSGADSEYSSFIKTDESKIRFGQISTTNKIEVTIKDPTVPDTGIEFPAVPAEKTQRLYEVNVSQVFTNVTSTALSNSDLNTAYPYAIKGDRIQCLDISGGAKIYEKSVAGWVEYSVTVVP